MTEGMVLLTTWDQCVCAAQATGLDPETIARAYNVALPGPIFEETHRLSRELTQAATPEAVRAVLVRIPRGNGLEACAIRRLCGMVVS